MVNAGMARDEIKFACDLCGKELTPDSAYHDEADIIYCSDCYHEDPEPYDVE